MADYKNPSKRVGGRMVGRMTDASPGPKFNRNRTPEQKEEDERQTQRAYEVWKAQREARLNKVNYVWFPEASGLRHKDIIM